VGGPEHRAARNGHLPVAPPIGRRQRPWWFNRIFRLWISSRWHRATPGGGSDVAQRRPHRH